MISNMNLDSVRVLKGFRAKNSYGLYCVYFFVALLCLLTLCRLAKVNLCHQRYILQNGF